MKGKIEKIISRTPHEKNGIKGEIVHALVDGEEVSGYTTKREFEVGTPVVYFFDTVYNRPKMLIDNKAKTE